TCTTPPTHLWTRTRSARNGLISTMARPPAKSFSSSNARSNRSTNLVTGLFPQTPVTRSLSRLSHSNYPWKRNFSMANFLFVYRNSRESYGPLTPEEMQQMLQKWQAWIAEGLQKGWMLEPGDGRKKEGRVVNAKKVVTDGPFIEVKEVVGGFSIVK